MSQSKEQQILDGGTKPQFSIVYKIFIFSIVVIIFLLAIVLSINNIPGSETYHKQANEIIAICSSTSYTSKPINYKEECEKNKETEKLSKRPFNLTVAFLSDQSSVRSSKHIYELIKRQGAEAIIHQGDFGTKHTPQEWEDEINEVLGEDYPIFVAMGNHDYYYWAEYYPLLQNRLKRIKQKVNDVDCRGCLGVRSVCSYKGLWIYQTSDGVFNLRENEMYLAQTSPSSTRASGEIGEYFEVDILRKELHCANDSTSDPSPTSAFANPKIASSIADAKFGYPWKICSWHSYSFIDEAFGGKNVEEGFNACIDYGALLINSHPHAYKKFYPISSAASAYSYEFTPNISRVVNGKLFMMSASSTTPILYPGFSMQIVTGLADDTTAAPEDGNKALDITNYAVLICTFNAPNIMMRNEKGEMEELIVNNDSDHILFNFAVCKYVSENDEILDHFTIYLS